MLGSESLVRLSFHCESASHRPSLRRRHLRTLTTTLITHATLADGTPTTVRQGLLLILPAAR